MDAADFTAVRDAVRRLVREDVVAREDEIEETDAIPEDIRRKAADMGLFGYTLPEEYGGLGASLHEDVRLAFEFGWTTPAFRSMFGTNNGIAGKVLVNAGTEEQQRHWLPRLAEGAVASFALTEAEAGSDPSGLTTRAVRDGDGYVLNGAKRFITNAPLADLFVVFARTGEEPYGTKGISVFLVEAGLPGVTVGPKDHKTGQAGAWTAEVFFDDVRVERSALVGGEEGAGFGAAMKSLIRGRIHIAALCVGMAERILEESVAHAAASKQGGRPIGEFQLVQGMLAEIQTGVFAGRAMVLDAAEKYDSGEDRRLRPSATKLYCSEMVSKAADLAVQIHGGMGYMRGTVVERCYRDARLFRIYEGTSEIQKLIIGRALLKGVK
ncbi:acyl-CoA dehydrogenase family protein [Streptomyces longispororuber]|uniref:acyl-CoA dehydrogenase family protein n=1 Tax=Streptomyces longispororuber TaxID=68230 RepID=UPI00210C4D5C|nr:acyl-CoA dehydrogenase family protein [Streptomyces longispororuber]MCQ4214117.1 acyl-CoA/acyl-ACP dehydrogenase [Streptomyces longispororuber]